MYRHHQRASLLSRRPGSSLTGTDWWDGSMTGIKLLLRSYNRLRLYLFFPSFYERTGKLDMQPMLLYPRRSRFAPKF